MKILSTFGEVESEEQFIVRSIACIKEYGDNKKIKALEADGGFYINELLPGNSFFIEIVIETRNSSSEDIVVNWFCSATKIRGALFYDKDINAYKGKIDGILVRESLFFVPQLLDESGHIISCGKRTVLWLEGNDAYFPITSRSQKAPYEHSFVFLEYDRTSGPNAILSKDCIQAVYNSRSFFCDKETGTPYWKIPAYFSLYEVWRQFIEVILNNEDIMDFDFGEEAGDNRILAVASRVLREIFPGSSYQDIKKLRQVEYPKFCSLVQSYFFHKCE